MQVELRFIDDIATGLSVELAELGYRVPSPNGSARQAAEICVQHWNAFARRIVVRPRAVHVSTQLNDNLALLPDEIRRGLVVVIAEIEAGLDLTVRLSRKLPKLRYNDGMLNDWGLHHLHLNESDRAKGTSHILILMVRENDAFLVDVREHQHWADQDLVEILHSNWPAAIAAHRLPKTVLYLTHSVSNEQIQALRSAGCTAPTQTKDGTIYMLLGGGITSSRDNISAVRWAGWLLGLAQVVEHFFDERRDWLADMIERQVGERPAQIRVHLVNLTKNEATLAFEHGGKHYLYRQPIENPPPVIVDAASESRAG